MADLNEFQRKSRAERIASVRSDIDSVLSEMDAHYTNEWRKASTVEAREDAHRYVTLLNKFRGHLSAVALSGAVASEAIALEERRRGWKILGRS